MPTVSVLPVSSVPEVFDRWSPGERSELIGSEFLDVLASVPDPRDPRGRRYSLMALLAIAVLATAAGMRGYAGFATWAATAPDDVLAQLGVRFRRPSEKTFRAVLSRLDPADLNARMGSYFTAHVASSDPSGLVPIALDGKMLRGALRAKATATHLVSVFAHRARLVLGQLAVAEKSNEIPCVRALLTLLPGSLRWLVTVDAMHTQVVTAKLICATLKSHYLMIVKSNQAKILARITALPWAEVPTAATDDSRGHGRVETRTLQIITAARGIGFPYAKQIIRITRERLITATDQRSVEVVYAICSLPFEHARPTQGPYGPRLHRASAFAMQSAGSNGLTGSAPAGAAAMRADAAQKAPIANTFPKPRRAPENVVNLIEIILLSLAPSMVPRKSMHIARRSSMP
ncbi:ISAs1 family transposase [Mycobacterium ulcerans]|uniref:ISAs1 family transposase n=2 Tax=Mycobacterium ulcerans TaxID=1809 RepID=UPI003B9697C4